MYSWLLRTALAVPTGRTPTASSGTPGSHVRTKRCSCATFLDKECVYFCHLDIIWVNTPERVVSYGLGSAQRTRRAAPDFRTPRGGGGPRCRCLRESDSTCRDFCRPEQRQQQSGPGTAPHALLRSPHELAADTGGIKRMKRCRVPPLASTTRLLLEKWRARQRRWARRSAAS